MADMNFAVNLLPATNNGTSLGSSDKYWTGVYGNNLYCGKIILNSNSYDTTSLPNSGTQGQLFFLIIN